MTGVHLPRASTAVGLTIALLAILVATLGLVVVERVTSSERPASDAPPPEAGYFETRPAGEWRRLPGDATCAQRVHRSTWEPRPDNFRPNHRTPGRDRIREALQKRPRAQQGAYDPRWDSWLLARVSGGFTGTTDEIFQWVACKWGLDDNLLRAVALRESGWYQGQRYLDGGCVLRHGCGDLVAEPTGASDVFCAQVAKLDPPTQKTYDPRRCPKTFSIVGVMSWQDPAWGRMPGNQNGTFPFNRRSTAFALDYYGAFLRGCYEGWAVWLANTGQYRAGDLYRCAGVWFAGEWDSPLARGYVARVRAAMEERTWLTAAWGRSKLPCDPARGCPRGAP